MINLTNNRNSLRLTVALLMLLFSFTAGAQTPWRFKQFTKAVEEKIALPYKGKKLWLFKKDSGWGLYDAETEQQLVPPHYDMVLPAIESIFYYVIKDNLVGFYAGEGGEIIPPNEFQQLQLVVDSAGGYYLQHARDVITQDRYYTTHTTEYRSFELYKDEQSKWSAREVSQRPFISNSSKVKIKDGVKWIGADQWVHQHAYIQKVDDQDLLTSPINYYKLVDQQSGVVSIDRKRYLIPPKYAEIKWQKDYFKARSYILQNQINPLAYAAVESIYTADFQLIDSPPGGIAGVITGGGYYTHDMNGTKVTLYDSLGKTLFTLENYGGYPEEVVAVGEKYYLACCPENISEEEMRVFRQSIYSREGQLLHTTKFRFEQIDEYQGWAIVSVIHPEPESFELDYGLYDLEQNKFLINPGYEQLHHISIKHSLVEVPNTACDAYYTGQRGEAYFLWDCRGQSFTAQVDFVSGQDYEVEVLDRPEVNSDSTYTTHIIEESFNDLTLGDLGYYNASIEDTYQGLIIYRCVHEYDQEAIYYALGGDTQLILAPAFTSIRFHKADETIHLEYENKTYVFPLSRYKD